MNDSEHWEVREIQLGGPIETAAAGTDTQGAYLQIWRNDIPLGHLWLDQCILPLSCSALRHRMVKAIAPALGNHLFTTGFAPALPGLHESPLGDDPELLPSLAALTDPLQRLDQRRHEQTTGAAPLSVSVIVCTRDRPDSLRPCLASLARLDPPASEVIVVDNASDHAATREVLKEFPAFILLAEPEPGLSRARNAGLRRAKGAIIAWTDDDVIVGTGWIREIRRGFAEAEISGLTGLVLPACLETPSQVRFERDFGGFNRGYRAMTFDPAFFAATCAVGSPVWMIGAGANMAFRREVFEKLGSFDERLGAGAAGCSEDSEMWYRMLAAGLSIRYEPAAVVWHAHRADGQAFREQMANYMRGHTAALLIQYEKHRHPGNLRRLFLSLPMYYWRVLKGTYIGAGRGTVRSEVCGCIRGILFYLRPRRRGQRSPKAVSGK